MLPGRGGGGGGGGGGHSGADGGRGDIWIVTETEMVATLNRLLKGRLKNVSGMRRSVTRLASMLAAGMTRGSKATMDCTTTERLLSGATLAVRVVQ